MKKVVAIIRTERVLFLKEQLSQIGIIAMTIGDITAWTGQKKFALQCRGIPVSYNLIQSQDGDLYSRRSGGPGNQSHNRYSNWKHGDGMITVSSLEQIINVSDLQKNEDALS